MALSLSKGRVRGPTDRPRDLRPNADDALSPPSRHSRPFDFAPLRMNGKAVRLRWRYAQGERRPFVLSVALEGRSRSTLGAPCDPMHITRPQKGEGMFTPSPLHVYPLSPGGRGLG